MTKPKERDHGVNLPEWWLEKVRELVEMRGGSYVKLGQDLARAYVAVHDRPDEDDEVFASRVAQVIGRKASA